MLILGVALRNRISKTAVLLVAAFATTALLCAQAPESGKSSQPAANAQDAQAPARVDTQNTQNPFPEDTSSVPVIPAHSTADLPPDVSSALNKAVLPADDADPVRTPENSQADAQENERSFSSSQSGMGNLLPAPDDNPQPDRHNKRGKQQVEVEHQETATEDESVGSFYLEKKDWRAALSRYQSALVLDPDNPDVYWGLAECQRHLGNLADARANYKKVVEYDPDSRHGKDARKALNDPQIANAKPPASTPAQQ
jgi:tetratricopeptide (TPR) repeat protein